MAKRKCRHGRVEYITRDGAKWLTAHEAFVHYGMASEAVSVRCASCGAQLSLGWTSDPVGDDLTLSNAIAEHNGLLNDEQAWKGEGFIEFSTSHDDSWPWDPTRPIAGQYEESLIERARERLGGGIRGIDVEIDVISGDELEHGVKLEVTTEPEPEEGVAFDVTAVAEPPSLDDRFDGGDL